MSDVVELCGCGHLTRGHDEDGCRRPDCLCPLTGTVDAAAAPAAAAHIEPDPAVELRRCNRCERVKPITEFYEKGDGFRQPMCRDCDNARPRTRGIKKIVRVRARHRATAELVKRHRAEFGDLLEYFTATATEEADQLAAAMAAERQDQPEDGIPRLRPGLTRKGQSAVQRLDRARCPECTRHHDRGHACALCGAAPHQEASA